MSEQDRKLFEMYGKKPAKNVLSNMQKVSFPPVPLFYFVICLARAAAYVL
jgi:hypothetical protein